jgi:hypothetical protein
MDGQDKDSVHKKRRRGLLIELSDRQSEVRELLAQAREETDKTVEDGIAGNLGYPDEIVIGVVLASYEMIQDEEVEITLINLIAAGEFLDHLDTQGLEVRRKTDAEK